MGIIDKIRLAASRDPKRIVLPESDDDRTLKAAGHILDNKIAKLVVIGREDTKSKIKAKNLQALEILDPEKFKDIDLMAGEYYEMRRQKGVTPEQAAETVRRDRLTFGAMLVRRGYADGSVAGAANTSADVIRAALRCIPLDKTIGIVSGAFLMEVPDSPYGENGVFIFADCGVNPNPDSKQLGGIAASAATAFKRLVGKTPRVAFLSYSSKGSAAGPLVEKISGAVKEARAISPDLMVDGEFQADSAIVPEVAELKGTEGDVAGRANVLIFPDLNSGNISYKLVQRLAGVRAIGPLLLGFTKPCSDLSRGCSVEDIVDAVAVTAIMA